MSKDQELAMGQQSDPGIINYFGIYEDKKLQRFIQNRGKEMAEISHRDEITYHFKIVDSPVVNAFAVPGGYVYFTRGIMAHFNNEAEFAGVLGHEIGHIAARHSAQQYSNTMLAQIGLIAGIVISPDFAQFADVAQQGLQLLFLKFGRDHESQSDRLGVEYSTKIGYDAEEMAGFFQTLDRIGKKSGGEAIPTFMSTHPDPADREQNVKALAKEWQTSVNKKNFKVNRDSYLKMIDGMVYGEDPKQGFVEQGVFYHPVLKFKFKIPNQWITQNTPQQLQMGQKDGKAMMVLSLAQGESLKEAGKVVLEQNKLNLKDSKSTKVNGLPALVLLADLQQQDGTLRTLTYLIQYDNNIYAMMGISQEGTFNTYATTFQKTMEDFSILNNPDKLNVKPDRIIIKKVISDGNLGQALKELEVSKDKMEELAILNGMLLSDPVEKGMRIKTIGK